MGHPTDIFSPAPADAIICAVCHDVLEDALSFKECGHTFCADCIKVCLRNTNRCPNCRVEVTGSNPNYALRDIIDPMPVKCPQWNGCEDEKKRKRGDENAESGCNWKGLVKDLKEHNKVCELKVIKCNIDGCKHRCKRKDMESHRSSAAGLMMHMELRHINDMKAMDRKYESKMKAMEREFDSKLKARDELATTRGQLFHAKMKVMEQQYEQKLIEGMEELEHDIEDKFTASNVGTGRGGQYGGGGFVLGAMASSVRGSVLNDAVLQFIKDNGAELDSGASMTDISIEVSAQGYSVNDIQDAVQHLSSEGHIYSTIDESHFQYAM